MIAPHRRTDADLRRAERDLCQVRAHLDLIREQVFDNECDVEAGPFWLVTRLLADAEHQITRR